VAIALLFSMVACGDAKSVEGEPGPAGPPGQDGASGQDGAPGDDGQNGQDGVDGQNGAPGGDGTDGEDGEDGVDGMDGLPGFAPAQFYVANNGASNAGTVSQRDETWGAWASLATGTNEGVSFDGGHNLVQAGDAAVVGLRTFCGELEEGDGFLDGRDRELAGPQTGLVTPKGLAVAVAGGFYLVADNGAAQLAVFGSAAAGDVPPVATTPLPAAPWDLAYDEPSDRLFVALVDGTVAVFDGYVAGGFSGQLDRVITPSDTLGAKISTNLHGIVYHADTDRLVVTDVGATTSAASADFASDGAIYVIGAASSAEGAVVPERVIEGPATLLGNPVDLVLDGADARVAEKAQNQLLVFRDVLVGESGEISPDYAGASEGPESLAALPDRSATLGVSDLVDPNTALLGVMVTRNPSDLLSSAAGTVVLLNRALDAQGTVFDAELASAESIAFSADGDAYVSFDDNVASGGVAVVGRLSQRTGAWDSRRDRKIEGALASLVSPRGMEVADALGWLFVSEFDAAAPGIHVFGTCASGEAAAIAIIDTEGARPWDVDYDPASDTLYAAFTNGTVGAYDGVSQDLGAGGPDRLITPSASGTKASVNLHGIRYDATSDTLLLSDVGDALVNTDGQLFTIPFASSADGNVEATKKITGALTMLGNPVDLAYDGRDLYVAEKLNGAVLLFRNFLVKPDGNLAPDVSFTVTSPESVTLVPAWPGF
jgi:hypothetical protein